MVESKDRSILRLLTKPIKPKYMKKYLLSIVFLASVMFVQAQNYFGVKAGGNYSHYKYHITSDNPTVDLKGGTVSFHAGGVAQIAIAENFAIRPELFFIMKGGDLKYQNLAANLRLACIDLPINFVYTSNGFFGGFGPNLSYGVSGKIWEASNSNEKYDVYTDEQNVSFFKLKRFEAGANVLAGYKLENGLFFSLNFSKGLTNSSDYDTPSGIKIKANAANVGLSVGYAFGGGK